MSTNIQRVYRLELNPQQNAALRYGADRRATTPALLLEQLVATILQERLIDAVLDDDAALPQTASVR